MSFSRHSTFWNYIQGRDLNLDDKEKNDIDEANWYFKNLPNRESILSEIDTIMENHQGMTSISLVRFWLMLVKHRGSYTREKTWICILGSETTKSYWTNLLEKIEDHRQNRQYSVHPSRDEVFSWMNHCNIWDVKVVILGQDPYPNSSRADGMAFSSKTGIPQSLNNIFKELEDDPDVHFQRPSHGNLTGWARQGVLLLNNILTYCRDNTGTGSGNLHKGIGWEDYTDAVIQWIEDNLTHVVFIVWGIEAQKKVGLIGPRNFVIDLERHDVLSALLPDDRAASTTYLNCPHFYSEISWHELLQDHSSQDCKGFDGCRHFSRTNQYLLAHRQTAINWNNLPNI